MENIAITVNIIVSLATVFSLVVIWLTLKEMRVQRLKSYEPILLPLNIEILFLSEFPKKTLPIESYDTLNQIITQKHSTSKYFKIVNIGQGVAKSINVTTNWNIDYERLANFLKSELCNRNIDIDMEVYDGSLWIDPNIDKNIFRGGNYPFELKHEKQFDYLLPKKDFKGHLKIKLPPSIMIILELAILLIESSEDEEQMAIVNELKETFAPSLRIYFRDNLNNKYDTSFTLCLDEINKQIIGDIPGSIYTLNIVRKDNKATNELFAKIT